MSPANICKVLYKCMQQEQAMLLYSRIVVSPLFVLFTRQSFFHIHPCQLLRPTCRSCSLTSEKQNVAQSPPERNGLAALNKRLAMAKNHEGVLAGAKAAIVAGIAAAIPTMTTARTRPWARANLNHTAEALIISTVAGSTIPFWQLQERTLSSKPLTWIYENPIAEFIL